MKAGMNLNDLLIEVQRQSTTKRDFVASTKEALRMVPMEGFDRGVALILHKEGGADLERFSITDNCFRQIAGRLNIPWTYFDRLLNDHRDLVMHQVNALFEREPEVRLMRTLDGKARAFLSNRFRPLDNVEVLEQVLPPIVKGDIKSRLISSNVGENNMHLKVLFTDDRLAQDIGATPHGKDAAHGWGGSVDANHNRIAGLETTHGRDVIRPGAIISNSETGHGSMKIEGFFWRAFCDNGCVWGRDEMFSYSRNHVGGKLESGELEFSDVTRRKQSEVIVAELSDVLTMLSSEAYAQKTGDKLRALKNGTLIVDPFKAIDVLAKEVQLRDTEKKFALESLIRDGDYSQWGMLNAVTEVANREEVSYERACELEDIGGKILSMELKNWNRVALAA